MKPGQQLRQYWSLQQQVLALSDSVRALHAENKQCAEAFTNLCVDNSKAKRNTAQLTKALVEVLDSIDVGGEQSRQFSGEIKTIRAALKKGEKLNGKRN